MSEDAKQMLAGLTEAARYFAAKGPKKCEDFVHTLINERLERLEGEGGLGGGDDAARNGE